MSVYHFKNYQSLQELLIFLMIKPTSINYIQPFKQIKSQNTHINHNLPTFIKNQYITHNSNQALTLLVHHTQNDQYQQKSSDKYPQSYTKYYIDNKNNHMRIQFSQQSSEISEDNLSTLISKLIQITSPMIKLQLSYGFLQIIREMGEKQKEQQSIYNDNQQQLELELTEEQQIASDIKQSVRSSQISIQKASKITFGQQGQIDKIPFSFKLTSKRKNQKRQQLKAITTVCNKDYKINLDGCYSVFTKILENQLKSTIKYYQNKRQKMIQLKQLNLDLLQQDFNDNDIDDQIADNLIDFKSINNLQTLPSNVSLQLKTNPSQNTIINQINVIRESDLEGNNANKYMKKQNNYFQQNRPVSFYRNQMYYQKQRQRPISSSNFAIHQPITKKQQHSTMNNYYGITHKQQMRIQSYNYYQQQPYQIQPRRISIKKNENPAYQNYKEKLASDHSLNQQLKTDNSSRQIPRVNFNHKIISPRSAPSSPMITRNFRSINKVDFERKTIEVRRANPQRSIDSFSSTPDLHKYQYTNIKPHSYYLGHINNKNQLKNYSKNTEQTQRQVQKYKKPEYNRVVQQQYYDSKNYAYQPNQNSRKKISLVTNRNQLLSKKKQNK